MSHQNHKCTCSSTNVSTIQTLDELDFERGIWNAAIHSDINALNKHIKNGQINARDNLGYTGKF